MKQITNHRYGNMALDPGNDSKMDIYHNLDDGRIVELRLGCPSDSDDAIWARNLTASEKEVYLQLKDSGYSDTDIYNHLNQTVNKAYAGN